MALASRNVSSSSERPLPAPPVAPPPLASTLPSSGTIPRAGRSLPPVPPPVPPAVQSQESLDETYEWTGDDNNAAADEETYEWTGDENPPPPKVCFMLLDVLYFV